MSAARNGRRQPLPSFQFYPADFLASARVQAMSLAEQGAYLRLLMYQHLEGGSLSADPEDLADYLGVPVEELDKHLTRRVRRCFEDVGGRLVNPRLAREAESTTDYRSACSEAGKRGAERRWATENATVGPGNGVAIGWPSARNGVAMGSDSSHPTPTHPNPVREERGANAPQRAEGARIGKPRRSAQVELQAAIDEAANRLGRPLSPSLVEAMVANVAHRRARGWSIRGREAWLRLLFAPELAAGDEAALEAALVQSETQGWQGVFPERHRGAGRGAAPREKPSVFQALRAEREASGELGGAA